MKKDSKEKEEHYAYCHKCQLNRGAVVPEKGFYGITIWMDYCPECGLLAEVIPNSDYNWPKKGKKANWD